MTAVGDARKRAAEREVPTIEAVLAEHARGDWSDRTFKCIGCAARFEEKSRGNPLSDEEKHAWRRAYNRISHPGWTLAEYEAHVAAAIRQAGAR